MDTIALVCAVELEAAPLLDRLTRVEPVPVHRRTAHRGLLDGRQVILLVAGMGKTNAAQALTSLFERVPVTGLIGFGVGGAYAGSDLSVGEVAIATSQHYGDEGVLGPEGWLSCEAIGIPLAEIDGIRYYNEFPAGTTSGEEAWGGTGVGRGRIRAGGFVTVSACSGTTARGAELARRFDAICETMEGAAYAHVAALYGVPYLEVRGISNLVEDRDMKKWRLREAATAACAGVVAILEEWRPSAPRARAGG